MKTGKFPAKCVNYGMKRSSAGEPIMVFRFSFYVDEKNVGLSYFGSLKAEKSANAMKAPRERTFELLTLLGFDFHHPNTFMNFKRLAAGPASGLLDLNTEVQVDVASEIGNDGKEYWKIKWINAIGGRVFEQTMSEQETAAAFAGMNLEADILEFRNKVQPKKKVEPKDEPIPF